MWWRRAMGPETELGDLHRYWQYGTSPLAAVKAGRNLNLAAIACLLVAITPANGPLLQRASSATQDAVTSPTVLHINSTTSLSSATGYIAGRQLAPAFLTSSFANIVQQFYDRTPITVKDTGCPSNAICNGRLRAAGFAVNCSASSFDFDSQLHQGTDVGSTYVDAFNIAFSWNLMNGGIQLNTQYRVPMSSDLSSCIGHIVIQNCTLEAATVLYPVTINGNQSTIALDQESTVFDDTPTNITTMAAFPETNGAPSQLAGYAVSLQNRFNGAALMHFGGAIGYEMDSVGATPPQFAVSGDENPCNMTFRDPLPNMLAQARELMFRTAMGFANETAVRVPVYRTASFPDGFLDDNSTGLETVSGTQTTTTTVYRTHYGFLIGAVALTVLSLIVVLITYHGFWHLGRDVSLSPLEIAKAFNAPLLASEHSNAEADDLVATVGKKHVKYELTGYAGTDVQDKPHSQVSVHGDVIDDLTVDRRDLHFQIVEQ
ncbi:hypothetical protein B0A48_05325 [Cryoendolithus antarcticus]|uniref:Uncharacterized protein n=1 Tax=Cryoendolithus antarcticus TaxID=1507870 RepID=A0A1V8TI81_9PEZI|nr:hypothetical protein B0A48_05325 [Cryoendolithus antarcticus]